MASRISHSSSGDLTYNQIKVALSNYDGDDYLQHNAFRSPGAPSIDELRDKPRKVEYFKRLYSKMHRHIYAHPEFINEKNVDDLTKMEFVFVCLDSGNARRLIIENLQKGGVPFIDVGMGVELVDGRLIGVLRTTTSSTEKSNHIAGRVPYSQVDQDEEYSSNIQIVDLNALNAALAVIKWKKLIGFYADLELEHSSTYTIDGNKLINEDQHEAKNDA